MRAWRRAFVNLINLSIDKGLRRETHLTKRRGHEQKKKKKRKRLTRPRKQTTLLSVTLGGVDGLVAKFKKCLVSALDTNVGVCQLPATCSETNCAEEEKHELLVASCFSLRMGSSIKSSVGKRMEFVRFEMDFS